MDMMYKYEFERKIIEQISICENRVLFLKNELIRAKSKLGKMISQKKLIEEKIKFTFLKEMQLKESKLAKDTPPFRKN